MPDGVAEHAAEFFLGGFFTFEKEGVVGKNDEREGFHIRISGRGFERSAGEFDPQVGLDELAAHHEEDEELENHVDERGHIDPGIDAACAGNEHGSGLGEKSFAEMGGDLVEIVDELVDLCFEDLGH